MKLKMSFDTEKIVNLGKNNLKYVPMLAIGTVTLVFLILTFFALYPREDAAQIAEGEKRVESLDIRYNTKLLGELGATKTPAQLGTSGGRDPFSGF